ncbi:MAG TPA: YceI family protein [Thermomicrobiales bacterium]|nr:YceI family protein [Thermomicrobiales bacterium]
MSTSVSNQLSQVVTSTPEWAIDSGHSSAHFSVKHMVVSNVKGRFGSMSGVINLDPERPALASVTASIDASTIDTHDERRDAHLRSDDFFNVEQFPTLAFASTSVEPAGPERWRVHGDLTIRDTTRPIVLDTRFEGSILDAYGMTRSAFTATTEINRKEFGLSWNGLIETGGAIVGDTVRIELNVAAVRQG